jgi:hypothetical protein
MRIAAGLPTLRFHDLRHSFITHAVEEGVPIEVVMAQEGHISAEMTRYYTHLGTRARERAATAAEHRNAGLLAELTSPESHRVRETSRDDDDPQTTTMPGANNVVYEIASAEQPGSLPPELLTKLSSRGVEKLAALMALLQS